MTFRFLAGLNPEFEQIRQSLWQRDPLPALHDTYAVVVQEESRRKTMTSVPVQEGSAMLSQPLTTSPQGDKVCDYCHRKNHTRETCWDLHGRPTRGRGRDGGHGRSQDRGRGLGRNGSGYKQAYVADTAGQSGSKSDDMLAQLMTQLARRLSTTAPTSATVSVASSSGVDGYNLSSLLTTVIKPIDTIMKALVAEPSLDES
jgi:hypothetical protein